MWKQYLGPHAQIVGLDIEPRCREFEEDQIAIRIGNQAAPAFLQAVINEFGQPNVVLDDGSHQMTDVAASFRISTLVSLPMASTSSRTFTPPIGTSTAAASVETPHLSSCARACWTS